jgi:hypothetical protein
MTESGVGQPDWCWIRRAEVSTLVRAAGNAPQRWRSITQIDVGSIDIVAKQVADACSLSFLALHNIVVAAELGWVSIETAWCRHFVRHSDVFRAGRSPRNRRQHSTSHA